MVTTSGSRRSARRACCRLATSARPRSRSGAPPPPTASDPVLNFFIERYTPAYLAEIDHFVDCVEKGSAPLVGYRDGREALRLADAALESMRTGQTVRLD